MTVSPEEAVIDREVVGILQTAGSRLPEEQRICVFMFYYENYSVAEIAKAIGCSENTVRGRLRYASANLRKQIENLGDDRIRLRAVAALPFLYIVFKTSYNNVYASAGEAGTIIFTNTDKNRHNDTYVAESNSDKTDEKVTGATLVESGQGGMPRIYNDKYFVGRVRGAFIFNDGTDDITMVCKDADGKVIYSNDKIDEIYWRTIYCMIKTAKKLLLLKRRAIIHLH